MYRFKQFTEAKITLQSKQLNIKDFVKGTYKLTPNGYDINGDVNLFNLELKKIPFKFNIVDGKFECGGNELETLENAPKIVTGKFLCYSNFLTSLKGCPERVDGSFDCSFNELTSLEGCPKKVGGNFYCRNNEREFSEKEIRKLCEVNGSIHNLDKPYK